MTALLDRRRFLAGAATTTLTATGLRSRTAHAAPVRGGRIVIGLIQEPGQLNPFFSGQSGQGLAYLAVEPLFQADARGAYRPVLAAEVPTLANGGISRDFLTVTYKLRPGVTWSDGKPFTAEDVLFTWEVYRNPESAPQAGAAYQFIESVTLSDRLTVRVKMKRINPLYLELWDSVLAKHKYESTAVTSKHEQARLPLGTGPFVATEWKAGDAIVFKRNPTYRDPQKPYLDGITVKITPQRDAAIASFIAGQLETVFFFVSSDLPTLQAAQPKGVHLALQEGPSHVEWLWLNLSDHGELRPHPVLGDPTVREAIDLGIDRRAIIDKILQGFGLLSGSFIYSGWAVVEIPPAPFDPTKANRLLDAAGWSRGGDGVRQRGGIRASLRYQTISGDRARELYQQVVQQNMKDLGIELKIQNVPSNTIFGGWKEGGLYARGKYDVLMSRAGYVIDPANWASQWLGDEIPSDAVPGGQNRVRYKSAEFDAAVREAMGTLDPAVGKPAYARAARTFAKDRPALPLYSSRWGWAWRNRLQGVSTNYWQGMWRGAADWYVTG